MLATGIFGRQACFSAQKFRHQAMSSITFDLFNKTLHIVWYEHEYVERLQFRISPTAGEELRTNSGLLIEDGVAEFCVDRTRFPAPTLCYAEQIEDPDTGKLHPATVCFYARMHPDLFNRLLVAPQEATAKLHVSTELLGPIKFADPLGHKKEWQTEESKQLQPTSFEIVLSFEPK
jgi:hypothetical protein